MASVALAETSIRNVKRAVQRVLPSVKSAHLTEAVAAAAGFGSQAALLAAIRSSQHDGADFVLLHEDLFVERVVALAGEDVANSAAQVDFERLTYDDANGILKTRSSRYNKIKFDSLRMTAWRNAMVSGINAGIALRLFSLRAGDNRWPGYSADPHAPREGFVYDFTVGTIPGFAYVGDAGFDELSIHVALWPTPDGRERVRAANAGLRAGELYASGWLERRDGAWLQVSDASGGGWSFSCRRARLSEVAGLAVKPRGYADRGTFTL